MRASGRQRFLAGLAAFATLFSFLLLPLLAYRVIAGGPLSGPGSDWEVWLLILSGAVGAGAGRLVHILVFTRVFRRSEADEERAWRGRR